MGVRIIHRTVGIVTKQENVNVTLVNFHGVLLSFVYFAFIFLKSHFKVCGFFTFTCIVFSLGFECLWISPRRSSSSGSLFSSLTWTLLFSSSQSFVHSTPLAKYKKKIFDLKQRDQSNFPPLLLLFKLFLNKFQKETKTMRRSGGRQRKERR